MISNNSDEATGKQFLPSIVRIYKQEYDRLTPEQAAELLREFDEDKVKKEHGFRVSTKSRVNDVTHTLKAIENEVIIHFSGCFVCKLIVCTAHQLESSHWRRDNAIHHTGVNRPSPLWRRLCYRGCRHFPRVGNENRLTRFYQ